MFYEFAREYISEKEKEKRKERKKKKEKERKKNLNQQSTGDSYTWKLNHLHSMLWPPQEGQDTGESRLPIPPSTVL